MPREHPKYKDINQITLTSIHKIRHTSPRCQIWGTLPLGPETSNKAKPLKAEKKHQVPLSIETTA